MDGPKYLEMVKCLFSILRGKIIYVENGDKCYELKYNAFF